MDVKRWIVKAGAASRDDMYLEDAIMPEPGPGEVRIKVRVVSLNRRDELLLTGRLQKASSDFIPASDGAGEIDAIGPGVERWSVGDRVIGNYFRTWQDGPPAPGQGSGLGSPGDDGMLTKYAVLKSERVTVMPKSLSYEEAACLPCAALTAWTALNGDRPYTRPLKEDAKVLVTGTGGVALFATLLARAHGAKVVATTSDDGKTDRIKTLGASGVINYRTEPKWGQTASERFGGFDHIVNAAGAGVLDQAMAAAAPGGEIALMGLYEYAEKAPNFIPLMTRGLTIRGTAVGSARALADLAAFIDAHGIRPPIAARFPFSDAKAAYREAASGKLFGKTIITVAE